MLAVPRGQATRDPSPLGAAKWGLSLSPRFQAEAQLPACLTSSTSSIRREKFFTNS